jgi:SAM-dependent methyltransferase
MYHRLWADWYLRAALPALERLLFSHLRRGCKMLDLCCGSGHVTRELVRRGYDVTAVDASAELIAIARRELPEANFLVQDARALRLATRFDAVLSTYDSLNHILNLHELRRVFGGVRRALKPEGRFVFDMNLEDAYALDLRQWTVQMTDGGVGLMRGSYDREEKLARTELIWFARRNGDLWKRRRSVVEERCYTEREIAQALGDSGFIDIEAVQAVEAGMRSDLGLGRTFFTARAALQK